MEKIRPPMSVFQFRNMDDEALRDAVSSGQFNRIRYFRDGLSCEANLKEWIRLKRPDFKFNKEIGL